MAILERFQEKDPLRELSAVVSPEEIHGMQVARRAVRVSEAVRSYITGIVSATRSHPALRLGASPRGSLGLMRASQALSALHGRDYVLPDDVKALAVGVLAHRLILKEEERLKGATQESIAEAVLAATPVPDGSP